MVGNETCVCHHNTPVVLLVEVTAVEVADVAGVIIVIVVTVVTAVAGTHRSDKRTTESCTSIYLHVSNYTATFKNFIRN